MFNMWFYFVIGELAGGIYKGNSQYDCILEGVMQELEKHCKLKCHKDIETGCSYQKPGQIG